jgi:hypothetical protein
MVRRFIAGAAALAAMGIMGAGCTAANDGFLCTSSTQCVAEDGSRGMCEPSGYCTFLDTSCAESFRRYGDAASSDLKGNCVGAAAGGRCVLDVSAGGNPAEADVAARSHTCALKTDGTVWCWGANDKGQLGDGTTTSRAVPAKVTGLPAVDHISAGAEHMCALTKAGVVYCWGTGDDAQLGVVDAGGNKIGNSVTPVKVTLLPGPAQAISAAGKHTCALVSGAIYCWGENATGELGDGSTMERPSPVLAKSIGKVSLVVNGDEHTCALDANRSLWCWGSNADGHARCHREPAGADARLHGDVDRRSRRRRRAHVHQEARRHRLVLGLQRERAGG